MKKITTILLVAVCLLMAAPAQAQLKFGLKAGLNLNNADFSGLKENFKSENMTGFFVGPMLDFKIPIVGLGLDASLLYSQKGAKFTNKDNNENITSKQHGLEIPINLKYSIGLGDMVALFIAAGPSFTFDLKSDNIGEDLADIALKAKETMEENRGDYADIARKTTEIGINLGIGAKLLNHLQLGVNYNIPLTDSAKKNFTSSDITENVGQIFSGDTFKTKNKMWQVSIAYLF